MSSEILISNIQLKNDNGINELSATINGDIIYFRVPEEYKLYPVAEGFIAMALLEAMYTNQPIVVEESTPVSKKLHESLEELQAIYASWNRELNIVDIRGEITTDVIDFERIGSFFSAGVDSSHTLVNNKDDISHLIMCWGFDGGNDQESWDKRIAAQTVFAESIGKKLLPVVTNAREWTDKKLISWTMAHGLFLSSVGGLLGMKRVYIPASHTYNELFPWGTHVLSDPMWSTESTEVIHHGAGARRSEKVRDIIDDKAIADNLQVCWRGIHENCGTCSKCIRTMISIDLLGVSTKALPPLQDSTPLSVLKPTDDGMASVLEDLVILAKEKNKTHIYVQLKKYYKWYQINKLWPEIDRWFLGGFFRRTYRKIKKPNWLKWRVTMKGSDSWDF